MYVIFVNEKPLILTKKKGEKQGFLNVDYLQVNIEEIIDRLYTTRINGAYVYHSSLEFLYTSFLNSFTYQEAAGGVVFNQKKQLLCIYRFNTWDLPKGGIEKGENKRQAAMREVEEECGVTDLSITKELPTTYHMYQYKGKHIFKITHWFEMRTTFQGMLIPQLEESITKAQFIEISKLEKLFNNSYLNIKTLLSKYM